MKELIKILELFLAFGITSFMLGFIFALASNIAFAAPPTPHTISGYIFYPGMINQVPLGTKYFLNDTSSGDYIESQTSLPIIGRSGYYSQTIRGVNLDNVSIFAWNNSNYGNLSIVLSGNMNNQNFSINQLRPVEPTVNITSPMDNSVVQDSGYFQIASVLTLYGNGSQGCNASILFSNQSVVSMYQGQPSSILFGSLQRGFSMIYLWNITPLALGSTNFTVNFTCPGEGLKFEKLNHTDYLFNISINDSTPSNISLIGPANNSWPYNGTLSFQFNITDFSSILNCSLYVDGVYNQTVQNPAKLVMNEFNASLSYGTHLWNVTCRDYVNLTSWSNTYKINVPGLRNLYVERLSYVSGEVARIFGHNWSDGNVSFDLLKSDYSLFNWNVSASNGIINTTYWINYSDPLGIYNISARQIIWPDKNASANFTVLARVPFLNTDKFNYGHFENVLIQGFNFSILGSISLSVFLNSSGQTGPSFPTSILANYSGSFDYAWNTTDVCAGIYGVFAQDLNWTPYNYTAYINLTDNTSCTTWANLAPNITLIRFDDSFIDLSDEIDLLSGQTTKVFCNVTVFDSNLFSDISFVNATIFFNANKSSDSDDNNTHYSSSSCGAALWNSTYELGFMCEFNVTYYAKNGTWICNATTVDKSNLTDTEIDSATINPLFAIDVSPVIDYGVVAPGNDSQEIASVVTNKGNVEVDLDLYAYAIVRDDNLSMSCNSNTNLSLNSQRYDLVSGSPFLSMTPANNSVSSVDFNLSKQTNSSLESKNVYWVLRLPAPQSGICNGSVVFTAI